jgi:chromosomal replication initiator protein
MKKHHPSLKIVYKKCEGFLEELIAAIKKGSTSEFKEKYRKADVLLIDDIQFLAGKEQTQEEFFHTFSALYENDKQIILTSDRPPKEIEPLSDRLRTRFEGGLLADVQPPSFELRIAIIKKKADNMGLTISNEIIEYLAERLHNNIRQIEGVLKKLFALTSLTSTEVTKEKVDEVISIIDPGNIPTEALVEKILLAVGKSFGVTVEDLKSKKKTNNIANARHVAIYVIKKLT